MDSSVIRNSKLKLKGSPLSGENPQPFFRQNDLDVAAGPAFPRDKKVSFGTESGFRVLPYTMQDRYSRELADMEFDSVVMENDFLRAEFIPALGGRMWSLFDKKRNRDVLFKNPVFRPANLAIRNAWFSGGIEWNIGRLGHCAHTCSPVFAGVFESDGLSILRIWEFERQSGLFWRIEFALPPDSPVLFSYVRIENHDEQDKPLYWWTNAAVIQTQGARALSASDEVIYIVPEIKRNHFNIEYPHAAGSENPSAQKTRNTLNVKTMDCGCLPKLPVLPGKDASYPSLSYYSNEYFFQNDIRLDDNDNEKNDSAFFPWEAAVYEDGFTFGEMSTFPLVFRKMFCWGQGRGGRRWQEFLSLPGQEYFEVQAGLSPTQLHSSEIKAGQTIDWVQAFTSFHVDAYQAHQADYNAAAEFTADQLELQIKKDALIRELEHGRKRHGMEARIISMGSGWGTLEIRLKKIKPSGLSFPDESTGEAQIPWISLFQEGSLPQRPPEIGPGSFVIGSEWERLLCASPARDDDWLTPYHLGVIYFERGETRKAVASWKESIKRRKNAWAYRNLALAAVKMNNLRAALENYRLCLLLDSGHDISFREEYIPLLLKSGNETQAAAELDECIKNAGSLEALSVPLLQAAAVIALKREDDVLLDKIFSVESAGIREGDTVLVDIWIEREIRRLCRAGKTREEALKQTQKALFDSSLVPPLKIDFRMY